MVAAEFRLNDDFRFFAGERPYHCDICGKNFRDSQNLIRHQKQHTGVGLVTCPVCGKQFTNSYLYRRHAASVHTGSVNS